MRLLCRLMSGQTASRGTSLNNMNRLIIWCKPFARYILIFWFLAIISVSSIPRLPIPAIHTAHSVIRLDYLIHFCEYGFLAFLSFLMLADKMFRLRYRKLIIITLCLILFAVLDEFHQKLIPGRTFNVKDIISNIAGIVSAAGFCLLNFRKITGNNV
jgi:VanZ family protein